MNCRDLSQYSNSSAHTNSHLSFVLSLPVRRRMKAALASALSVLIIAATPLAAKVCAQSASGNTISTIAGGGYSTSIAVRQAPMSLPTAVARDPQGRGFFVIDEINSSSLLRFVNTSSQPVTLAGITIQAGGINLIAGGGLSIEDNAGPRETDLALVSGLAVDPSGNAVYLGLPSLGVIRAINLSTQNFTVLGKTIAPGKIVTIATPTVAEFRALALRAAPREFFYIGANVVYRIDQNGAEAPFAGGGSPSGNNGDGGPATAARLIAPLGLALDGGGNLLIAEGGDTRNNPGALRKVAGGTISSLAANLAYPNSVAVAPDGNAYVSLGNGQRIIRVTPAGATATVAGNSNICNQETNPTCGDGGAATSASLNLPGSTDGPAYQLAADATGILVPEYRYARVRYVNLSGGAVQVAGINVNSQQIDTVTGSGQPAPFDNVPSIAAELNAPTGVAADAQGNLFISDTNNNRLRFVNRGQNPLTLFQGSVSEVVVPPGQIVTLNKSLNDPRTDDRITTASFAMPQGMALTSNGILFADSQNGIRYPSGTTGKRTGVIRFLNTSNASVTFFPGGGAASVVVEPGMVKSIVGVPLGSVVPQQNIGDGGPANKGIIFPTDVTLDAAGNIYVADQGNNLIRKVDANTGVITSLQARQSDGSLATLTTGGATGVAFDSTNRLLIADTKNNRVLRQNDAGGDVFTVIADSSLGLNRPRDLIVDSLGRIFIASTGAPKVLQLRAVENALGTIRTIAGTGTAGFSGDGGAAEQAQLSLANPGSAPTEIQVTSGLALFPNGDLALTDTANNRIRLLQSRVLAATSVSAANYAGGSLAGESVAAVFGNPLATTLAEATSLPLPTTLAGTSVKVTDSAGAERLAPLFFVSQFQVNYQVPPGTANGAATVTVTSGDGTVSVGTVQIESVKPGMFTADSSGQGLAAALALRVKTDNSLVYEPVSRFDTGQNKFVAVPIDMTNASEKVFLVLFGTGFRNRSSLPNVAVSIGGARVDALYAGEQGGFVGLDQLNIEIPRSLIGRGDVDINVTVDGKAANVVKVNIK